MFKSFKKSISKLIKKITITELSEKSIRKFTFALKEIMIQNEIAVTTADTICDELTKRLINMEHNRFKSPKNMIIMALRETLIDILSSDPNIDLLMEISKAKSQNRPFVIAFFGINGVGKTLSIAKLGYYLKNNGYTSVFSASDTFRAGSIQQLQEHAKKLKIKCIAQTYGSDAAAVAIDAINHAIAKEIDVVLIDTAGRMETNKNLMSELEKLTRVAEPDLKIFVGDALTGNALVSQAKLFNEKIGIDAIIINKMDADVKGGAAVSVTQITKKPILFIGTGQSYKDMEKFIPEKVVEKILP